MRISENQTPERLRGSRSKILRKIGRFGINISGWTIKGKIPDEERIVLIAAPHTSNWDFILAMLAIFGSYLLYGSKVMFTKYGVVFINIFYLILFI